MTKQPTEMEAVAMYGSEEKTEMDDMRAQSDCRALLEAEEIKKDKPRYRRALKAAREKMAALKEVSKEA
ncbi:MAG TPA: hypothetical protein VKA19_04415 [Alphaproteobacteria bacterium]|nr:hypothetical protein [Alphaproteobacteria bacterium]